MGLLDKIKGIFKRGKTTNGILSESVVAYNTRDVEIPEYKELSKEEKEVVDKYLSEIDLKDFSKMMAYGDEMIKYANGNTDLLLNLAFKISEQNEKIMNGQSAIPKGEEGIQTRLNNMINKWKLELYSYALHKIEKEATLRIIALEQFNKSGKGIHKVFSILKGAEIIKNNAEQASINETIERMKIIKQMVENQIGATKIQTEACKMQIEAINKNEAIKNVDNDEIKGKAIEERAKELKEMARTVKLKDAELELQGDEENQVKQLAMLEWELEVYGYIHKDEIEKIREEVKKLGKEEKTKENKEEILRKVNEIRTKYKVFGRYITEECLEELYKVKFEALTFDITEQGKSPFIRIKNKEELKCYEKILLEKLNEIVTGENENFKKTFGENVPEAVETIREILKGENSAIEMENVLYDKTMLSILLAFDKEDIEKVLEKIEIPRKDIKREWYDDLFAWNDKIPLKGLRQLRKLDEKKEKFKTKKYENINKLYNLYEDNKELKTPEEETTGEIPEGIYELRDIYGYITSVDKLYKKIRDKKNVICPSTLRTIGANFFKLTRIKKIIFNDCLEEIYYGAFAYCSDLQYTDIPSSVKEIGVAYIPKNVKKIARSIFYKCTNLKKVYLPKGIEVEGDLYTDFDFNIKLALPEGCEVIYYEPERNGEER